MDAFNLAESVRETESNLTIHTFVKSTLHLQKFASSKHASIVHDFLAESALAIFWLRPGPN